MSREPDIADVIIVGAGLAGLVAAAELADANKRVIIVDQESEQNLAGSLFPTCTRLAKSRVLAAAGCTATGHSKGHFLVAACSQAALPGAPWPRH